MSVRSTKLPKQWKYWCKKNHLKLIDRTYWNKYYLIGRNRCWRIDCDDIFECSCPLEHFDRWANSRGASWHRIPQTESEFHVAITTLLLQSEDKK